MAEHADLVSEIPFVEKMSTAERLKHAKKRRQSQLKKYSQYDKQLDKDQKRKTKSQAPRNIKQTTKRAKLTRVQFVNNIRLLEAAARNDVEEVEELLQTGVNADMTNEDGLTALHQCCIDDQEALLKLLLKYGANVNAKDSELWTPLHAAATCGHVHLCKLLIDHGAELLPVNADGNMPYDICEDDITLDFIESEMAKRGVTQELIDEIRLSSEKKMLEDMIKLVQEGGNLEFKGRAGETPLHIASANGYIQVAEFLMDQHVALSLIDDDSWQPIHAAACWGHLHILELLVQHGADLEVRTKSGETPLDICEDQEIRQRIMEMRDEIQSHRASRSRDLRRRRSHNSRSGQALYSSNSSLADKVSTSIRRTSMREKTPIALREAREEAQRLRNSTASTDEEEINEETGNQGVVNGLLKEEPSDSANLDAVRVEFSPASPFVKPDNDEVSQHNTTALDNNAKTSNFNKPAESSGKNLSKMHPQVKDTFHIPTNKTDSQAASSLSTNKITDKVNSTAETSLPIYNNTESKMVDVPMVPSTDSAMVSSAETTVTRTSTNMLTPPTTQPFTMSTESLPNATPSPHGTPSSESSTPSSKTLADLKKMRAQKIQGTMKTKDSSSLNSQMDEYSSSHGQSDSENNLIASTNGSEGHNGLHNNTYYIQGETPKHKFTASRTEIIGGSSDTNTSCCVIL